MKKLLFIFLLCSVNAFATKYYISPSGSDGAAGTLAAPRKTINSIWSLVTSGGGDTIYLRGGTYLITSEQIFGSKNDVKIFAYPGEYPIIDGTSCARTSGALLKITSCSRLHIMGIEIQHYHFPGPGYNKHYGLYTENMVDCTFELLEIHHNDVGMMLTGHSTGNQIINCDFHHNADPRSSTAYNNGDGLSMNCAYYSGGWQSDTTSINTVTGCRFWWNTDNGVSVFYNNGLVNINNCWAWKTGYIPGLTESDRDTLLIGGDGIGFKLGQTNGDFPTDIKRSLRNCVSAYNAYIGFDQNQTTMTARIQIYNSTAYHNVGRGYHMAYGDTVNHVGINNISYANGYIGYWHLSSTLTTNTFTAWNANNTALCTVSDADFLSLDYTEMEAPRKSDGSLPDINFLHLVPSSDLVDKGTYVGIDYSGTAPDIGAFEYVIPTTKRYFITLTR